VRAHALKAIPALIKKAREHAAEGDGKSEYMEFFAMNFKYRFGALADRLESLLASAVPATEAAAAASGGAGASASP
jgi:hypothetical protein